MRTPLLLILFITSYLITACKARTVTTTEIRSVELTNVVEEDPPEPPPPPPPPPSSSQSWDNMRVNAEDSAALKIVWDRFVAALHKKDAKEIREISLTHIDCVNLADHDADFGDWFIPIDTFITRFAVLDSHIDLLGDIEQGRFRPVRHVIEDFKPKSLPGMDENDLILYELPFVTLKPNELEPGHEGASMIFQFVKLKEGFKFYGMFSVP